MVLTLIDDAAAKFASYLDMDDDEPTPPPHPPLTIWILLHAIQAALPDPTLLQQSTAIPKTTIPLKMLFIFPTDKNSLSIGMEYFWQGGIKNLDTEMGAYELLSSSEETAGKTNTDVPVACSSTA